MHKWRYGTSSQGQTVSLQHVLDVRGGPLNEVECWALLGQAGQALQDHLLSVNGRHCTALTSTSSLSAVTRYDSLVICPAKLLCTGSGKVSFDSRVGPAAALLYRHPSLGVKLDLNERELEAVGVFSLGKTAQHALNYRSSGAHSAVSRSLRELLDGMMRLDLGESVTLLGLLQTVSEQWQLKVGSSPLSRFVSQLCRVTLGWASTSAIALTNHDSRKNVILDSCLAPAAATDLPQAVEVEFSKLDASSSSSASSTSSASSPLSKSAAMAASMPNLNNNHPPQTPAAEGDSELKRLDLKGEDCTTYENLSRKSLSSSVVVSSSIRHAADSTSSAAKAPSQEALKTTTTTTMGYSGKRRRSGSSNVITCPASARDTNSHHQRSRAAAAAVAASSTNAADAGATASVSRRKLQFQSQQTPVSSRSSEPRSSSSCSRVASQRGVRRNPSRLYRQVKPLTDIPAAMSPATKRCVGPEFVVMAENPAVVIDLSSLGLTALSRRDGAPPAAKQVHVVMVNGQRLAVHVNPHAVTAGEVLDHVLSHQDIKESAFYGLAVKSPDSDEYWMLSNDTKLHKVAPNPLWKDAAASQHGIRSTDAFSVYLRFKHLPASLDAFRDPHNKHQFYLQLRRDVIEGRYNLPSNIQLALAGLALQTEFGDFSDDLHGECDYFLLEHYLPSHVIRQVGVDKARVGLARLHRAHLSQSQSKTELKYCQEVQRSDNFGFHNFSVRETKKPMTNRHSRHLGIHMQGVHIFETSRDPAVPHKLVRAYQWHEICRIQYDKTRFQLSVEPAASGTGGQGLVEKVKFYVAEVKAKLMFDLASAQHQFYIQRKWDAKKLEPGPVEADPECRVEYREPRSERTIRSIKNRLLAKRQISQRKLYTKESSAANLRSRTRTLSSGSGGSASTPSTAKLMVKRLTHYSSMADALTKTATEKQGSKDDALNESNKENQTPNAKQPYRYKVYLEPEEDLEPRTASASTERRPLQERPLPRGSSPSPPPLPPPRPRRPPITSASAGGRRRSESVAAAAAAARKSASGSRRSIGGGGGGSVVGAAGTPSCNGANPVRMGTRISLSALHRERLRLTTEFGHQSAVLPPAAKKPSLDLDYGTMEFKSLLPQAPSEGSAYVVQASIKSVEEEEEEDGAGAGAGAGAPAPLLPAVDDAEESLTESLIERFDNMESEDGEPERQIVSASLTKGASGRLGLKITGTPSGIYIDEIDASIARVEGCLQLGDRIVAINGRSLENVAYSGALELIRKSGPTVQLLVSQIKQQAPATSKPVRL